MLRDAVHVGAGLGQCHAGLEEADGARAFVDAAIAKRRIVPLADGGVDVAVDAVKGEAWRQDADDGVVGPAESDGLADDLGTAAKAAVPEAVAEQSDRRGA